MFISLTLELYHQLTVEWNDLRSDDMYVQHIGAESRKALHDGRLLYCSTVLLPTTGNETESEKKVGGVKRHKDDDDILNVKSTKEK